jgi:hypothetical protein
MGSLTPSPTVSILNNLHCQVRAVKYFSLQPGLPATPLTGYRNFPVPHPKCFAPNTGNEGEQLPCAKACSKTEA